jgi:hypothetical protein
VKSPETADTGSNEALSSEGNARLRIPPDFALRLLVEEVEVLVEILVLDDKLVDEEEVEEDEVEDEEVEPMLELND